jgi:hypothetical protein
VVGVAAGVATWFLPELSGFMLEQLDKAAMISKAGIRGLNISNLVLFFNDSKTLPASWQTGQK